MLLKIACSEWNLHHWRFSLLKIDQRKFESQENHHNCCRRLPPMSQKDGYWYIRLYLSKRFFRFFASKSRGTNCGGSSKGIQASCFFCIWQATDSAPTTISHLELPLWWFFRGETDGDASTVVIIVMFCERTHIVAVIAKIKNPSLRVFHLNPNSHHSSCIQ